VHKNTNAVQLCWNAHYQHSVQRVLAPSSSNLCVCVCVCVCVRAARFVARLPMSVINYWRSASGVVGLQRVDRAQCTEGD